MRLASSVLILVLVVLAAAGCGRSRTRCERSCTRMAECGRELMREQIIDLGECIDECSKLDRDPPMQRFVEEHARCVDNAESCARVLECK